MSNKKRSEDKITHHPLYATWRNIIDRTTAKSHPSYKVNKARNVQVCRRWAQSFKAFVRDMGDKKPGQRLKRRNNYRDYDKTNCYWADYKTSNNTHTYVTPDVSESYDDDAIQSAAPDIQVSLDLD